MKVPSLKPKTSQEVPYAVIISAITASSNFTIFSAYSKGMPRTSDAISLPWNDSRVSNAFAWSRKATQSSLLAILESSISWDTGKIADPQSLPFSNPDCSFSKIPYFLQRASTLPSMMCSCIFKISDSNHKGLSLSIFWLPSSLGISHICTCLCSCIIMLFDSAMNSRCPSSMYRWRGQWNKAGLVTLSFPGCVHFFSFAFAFLHSIVVGGDRSAPISAELIALPASGPFVMIFGENNPRLYNFWTASGSFSFSCATWLYLPSSNAWINTWALASLSHKGWLLDPSSSQFQRFFLPFPNQASQKATRRLQISTGFEIKFPSSSILLIAPALGFGTESLRIICLIPCFLFLVVWDWALFTNSFLCLWSSKWSSFSTDALNAKITFSHLEISLVVGSASTMSSGMIVITVP